MGAPNNLYDKYYIYIVQYQLCYGNTIWACAYTPATPPLCRAATIAIIATLATTITIAITAIIATEATIATIATIAVIAIITPIIATVGSVGEFRGSGQGLRRMSSECCGHQY